MNKKDIGYWKAICNNFYAIKMCFQISKSRVVHTAITRVFGYFSWLFYSIFFMRYVIKSIENERDFEDILRFIIISSAIISIITLYDRYVSNYVKTLTGTLIFQGLYQKLYHKSRNVELRCFEDAEFYNKYTMALDGASDRLENMVENFFGVIFGVVAASLAFYSMYSIDHLAIFFIIFPIIGNFVFGGVMNRIYTKRYQDDVVNNRKSDYVNRVMYLADYAKEVRLSKVFHLMMRKYREAVDGNIAVVQKYAKKAIVNNWLQNVLTFAIVFEGIMLYAAYRTMVTKSIGLAELAVMFSIMSTSSWILFQMFASLVKSLEHGLFIQNLRSFLEYQERIPEDQQGITPDPVIHSIEFRNVSFYYQEDQPLINNLSFHIRGKSTVAFVGHNGAGKSTIMKLLFRLYDPTEGVILLNGINIKEYCLKEYRKLFAAAFQEYKVLALSVKNNVLMGRELGSKVQEDELVIQALIKAGIYDKVREMPHGIYSILTKEFDEEGVVLSGGQYQKLIVARAFAQDTPIQVFDEPSSALDPIAEYQMYQSIMRESKEHLLSERICEGDPLTS